MKSINKRVISILVCLLMLVMALPCQIIAGAVDISQTCDLTVDFTTTDGLKASGVTFNIYKIADLTGEDEWLSVAPFTQYGLIFAEDPTAEDWDKMSKILKEKFSSYSDKYTATKITNSNGVAVFENLKAGLYYVVPMDQFTTGGWMYTAAPTLVALPYRDVNSSNNAERVWQYDVTIEIKSDSIPLDEEIDISVFKIWKGDDDTVRPTSVSVGLYNGGVLFETIELSAVNGWKHTWKDLDSAGKWGVKELNVPAEYKSTVVQKGNSFEITNTYTVPGKDEPEENLPQTGVLWWPVPYLACAGVLCMFIGMVISRRRNGNES